MAWMQGSRVLVVERDHPARHALATCLRFTGVEVHEVDGLSEARGWLAQKIADVIILADESIDSLPACASNAGVVMLTRCHASANLAADEVLRRPVPVSVVVERVEALIQRRQSTGTHHLQFDD